MIDIKNLAFKWPNQDASLKIPHLSINSGEHLLLQGSSGCGKTTLLNLITGMMKADQGQLNVLGQDFTQASDAQRDRVRADHMGVIFQQFNLLPWLSLTENIMLPCRFSKLRSQQAKYPEQEAKRLLAQLQLDDKMTQCSVQDLSVGQQQRVAAARALIGSPKLIIADEPTSALDSVNRDRFLQLLFQESEKQGSTIVMVSHDESMASYFERTLSLAELNQAHLNQEAVL